MLFLSCFFFLCGSVAKPPSLNLHITNVQLQSNLFIPAIYFQLIREIDALIGARRLLVLFQAAPPDCLKRAIVFSRNAQLEMLFLNYLGLAHHPKTAGYK